MFKWIGKQVYNAISVFQNLVHFEKDIILGGQNSRSATTIKKRAIESGGGIQGGNLHIQGGNSDGTDQAGGTIQLNLGLGTGRGTTPEFEINYSALSEPGSTQQSHVKAFGITGSTGITNIYKGLDIKDTSVVGFRLPSYPNTDTASGLVDIDNIQTSGSEFNDNDTSLLTAAAIEDKIEASYAYTYMTWSASGTSTHDGSGNPEWVFPNQAKGIYEEDWTRDEDISATTPGTTVYTTAHKSAVNALVIPHTGICVGFHAHGRNDDSDLTFKAGLFHYDGSTTGGTNATGIDYGSTGSGHDLTLRWVATANEAEASGGTDGSGAAHSFKGPCKLVSNTDAVAVTAGDALLPAIMGNDSNTTDEIFVTMTIILKIPLTT